MSCVYGLDWQSPGDGHSVFLCLHVGHHVCAAGLASSSKMWSGRPEPRLHRLERGHSTQENATARVPHQGSQHVALTIDGIRHLVRHTVHGLMLTKGSGRLPLSSRDSSRDSRWRDLLTRVCAAGAGMSRRRGRHCADCPVQTRAGRAKLSRMTRSRTAMSRICVLSFAYCSFTVFACVICA